MPSPINRNTYLGAFRAVEVALRAVVWTGWVWVSVWLALTLQPARADRARAVARAAERSFLMVSFPP